MRVMHESPEYLAADEAERKRIFERAWSWLVRALKERKFKCSVSSSK